ncbi:MAG: glutamate-1-semialdehyde 2,1-aminomutase [Methanobacteriaceae archaeon]|nr:glutamate-1-semialdehyde 2,1-aminomutase [Methanobacteriaceae archaeon]
MSQKSELLFNESKKYLPGGVNSPVRAFKPYPFFVDHGKGSCLYDVDGNKYIDYCLGYGPLVLGHVNKKIVEDITTQLSCGTTFGVPSEKEIQLAKMVVDRVPCADMVRFTNSGTEATMSAIRLARAATNSKKIIKFIGSYHGAHDAVLVKSGSGAVGLPDSPGVPSEATENTILVPFNDKQAIEDIIKEYSGDIACIIVEPIMGNIGCIAPKDDYLSFLRKITSDNGIILIFDEVITGFRIASGGAQEYYGVTPDLVTFGKIVGGGFPIGAFAGKKEFMNMIAPEGNVYQAGTFSGNPISITGGISTLTQLGADFYSSMHDKGEYLRTGIKEVLSDLSIDYTVVGVESMFQVYFTSNDVYNYDDAQTCDVKAFDKYFHNLLDNGVFIAPSQFECGFISRSHNISDLDKTIESIKSSLI